MFYSVLFPVDLCPSAPYFLDISSNILIPICVCIYWLISG